MVKEIDLHNLVKIGAEGFADEAAFGGFVVKGVRQEGLADLVVIVGIIEFRNTGISRKTPPVVQTVVELVPEIEILVIGVRFVLFPNTVVIASG